MVREREGMYSFFCQRKSKYFSIFWLAIVLDDDCMNTEIKEDLKYLILREDCKLYSKWDSKASLIF